MHRSSLDISSGNFIVSNPTKAERKYISFTNSVINVENNGNVLNGHMELNDNVEMSLLSSDVVIDGDLILTGKASLNVFEESSFHIPNGIVSMEETSSIIIDGASSLLNQGQLVAPGSLRVPSDSSASNEGILESSHDFNSNCFADLSNGAPLSNSGTFNMAPSSSDYTSPLQSCVDNMQHSGLMQLAGTNMTFNIFQSTSSSTIASGLLINDPVKEPLPPRDPSLWNGFPVEIPIDAPESVIVDDDVLWKILNVIFVPASCINPLCCILSTHDCNGDV